MDSANIETPQSNVQDALPQEIQHVPPWVKAIVVVGAVLFAIQLPDFKSSLTDAIQKSRASSATNTGQYTKATEIYTNLHSRYPTDKGLVKQLGFAQYHAGQYTEAIATFNLLAGVKMPKREVEEINAAISDIASKLQIEHQVSE